MTRPLRSGLISAWVISCCLQLACAEQATSGEARDAPDHATQEWPAARLLVWAKPGESGLYHLPLNWLEDGQPAEAGPDADTDVLLPAADRVYLVRPEVDGLGSKVSCRHITVERNAGFAAGYDNIHNITVTGNILVREGGRLNNVRLFGHGHTFVRFEGFDFREGDFRCTQVRDPLTWAPNVLSWKFDIVKLGSGKLDGGSVTFQGCIGIVDEVLVHSGTVIIDEDSELRFGKSTTGALEIFAGATVELRSGAVLGPFTNQKPREAQGNVRILRGGTLRGGSPEHPLERDAYLLLGCSGKAPSSQRIHGHDVRDPVGLAHRLLAGEDALSRTLVAAQPDLAGGRIRSQAEQGGRGRLQALALALALGLTRAASQTSLASDEILDELELAPDERDELRAAGAENPHVANRRVLAIGYARHLSLDRNADGVYAAAGSRIAVHSGDPATARLVVTSLTAPIGSKNGATRPLRREQAVGRDYGIELDLAGDVELSGLCFDYVRTRGIGLPPEADRTPWLQVALGDHCAPGAPASLLRELAGYAEWAGDLDRNTSAIQSMDAHLFLPTITPAAAAFQPHETLQVEMSIRSQKAEIRFTRDGKAPEPDSELYTGPLTLARSQTLTAAAFHEGRRCGEQPRRLIARASFTCEPPIAPITAESESGVAWQQLSGRDELVAEGQSESLRWQDLGGGRPPRDARFVFTGYLRVPETGGYTFTSNHLGCRVTLAGRVIADTLGGNQELTGSLVLAAGLHPLCVEVLPSRGAASNPLRYGDHRLRLTWQTAGLAQQPIPSSALFRDSAGE